MVVTPTVPRHDLARHDVSPGTGTMLPVHNAGGGMGTAATQVGRDAGARVICPATPPDKRPLRP
jgi:NADPH:quinone reductase-like Zn-dependent oxidoreductase